LAKEVYFIKIYCRVRRWKKIENRSTFGKDMGKSTVSCFFWLTGY